MVEFLLLMLFFINFFIVCFFGFAEIDGCLVNNGGCHMSAECIKTGPNTVRICSGVSGHKWIWLCLLNKRNIISPPHLCALICVQYYCQWGCISSRKAEKCEEPQSLQPAYIHMVEIIWNFELIFNIYSPIFNDNIDINANLDLWSTSKTWRSMSPQFQCYTQTLIVFNFFISIAALWTQTIQLPEIRLRERRILFPLHMMLFERCCRNHSCSDPTREISTERFQRAARKEDLCFTSCAVCHFWPILHIIPQE